jgi:hypothetical protein
MATQHSPAGKSSLSDTLDTLGGRGVFIETPDSLVALLSDPQHEVDRVSLGKWK